MLRKPSWRSPSCGDDWYTCSGTTHALERLLDRGLLLHTGINVQVFVLRLNELHCVFRLCRQAAEPIFQKYSICHEIRLWWIRRPPHDSFNPRWFTVSSFGRLIHGYGLGGGFCLIADSKLYLQFRIRWHAAHLSFMAIHNHTFHATLYSIHQLSSLLNPCFCGQFSPLLSLIDQSFAFLAHYSTFVFVDPVLSAIYYLYHFLLNYGYTLVLRSLPLWSHDDGNKWSLRYMSSPAR